MEGGSVMVWGAFSACGRSDPIVLRGMMDSILNSKKYSDTLQSSFPPFVAHYDFEVTFQQDNAPIRTS